MKSHKTLPGGGHQATSLQVWTLGLVTACSEALHKPGRFHVHLEKMRGGNLPPLYIVNETSVFQIL